MRCGPGSWAEYGLVRSGMRHEEMVDGILNIDPDTFVE